MSFRYSVATGFLYGRHAKVAAEVEQAFGATIVTREPCVVAWFSSTDEGTPLTWFDDARISVPFAIITEAGEV